MKYFIIPKLTYSKFILKSNEFWGKVKTLELLKQSSTNVRKKLAKCRVREKNSPKANNVKMFSRLQTLNTWNISAHSVAYMCVLWPMVHFLSYVSLYFIHSCFISNFQKVKKYCNSLEFVSVCIYPYCKHSRVCPILNPSQA